MPGCCLATWAAAQRFERPLLDIVNRLRTGQVGPRLAYLYGPRGNGKTVLLQWLAEHAKQEGGGATYRSGSSSPGTSDVVRDARPAHSQRRQTDAWNIRQSLGQSGRPEFPASLSRSVRRLGTTRYSGCRTGWSRIAIRCCSPWTKRTRPTRWCSAGFSTPCSLRANSVPSARFWPARPGCWTPSPPAAPLSGAGGRNLRSAGCRTVKLTPCWRSHSLTPAWKPMPTPSADLARSADDYPYFLQLYGAAAWDAVESDSRSRDPPGACQRRD